MDDAPLDTPIEEEFRVGTMSLAWDGDTGRVAIECYQARDEEAAEPTDEEDLADADPQAVGSVLRVWLSGQAARAFVRRALAVVAAGRPPCPFCGNPLDATGHVCPRANGYRR